MKSFFQQLLYGVLALIAVFGLMMTLQGGPVIGLVVSAVIIAGFYFQHRNAQKALRTSVGEIDSLKRPLVVYLRSFGAEEHDRTLLARLRQAFGGSFISGVSNPLRDEEQEALARIFHEVGLYVAIGKPGEALPCPGAKKVYVGDDEWQNVVSRWLNRSVAVVLEPGGGGQGLTWEIHTILRKVKPEKVLIILPRIHADYQVLRDDLGGVFPKPLPREIGREIRLLTFTEGWEPKPIGSLFPFFRQNGFQDPKV